MNYNESQREAEKLILKIKNHNQNVIAVRADVSKRSECQFLVDKTIKHFGQIDVLVNNAGIAQQKLFTEISPEDWQRMFAVNVESAFNCTQFAVNDMLKRHSGKIINVSSIWGLVGSSCEVHYSASKAALIGFTKALAKELGPSKITVNCIAPGIINTKMNKSLNEYAINDLISQTPLGRFGTADEIAKTILFLASESADFLTGQVISPNGGFVI
ncbi:3-oxoacyl-ACP reductase [Clostridia bacterium]|nr:3-oxoacyl-ACP reductase [Clostridia bacterium]